MAEGYNLENRTPIGRQISEALRISLTLCAHPFAAYCWKASIAPFENETPFTYRVIEDAAGWADLESLWPIKKLPLLRDGEALVVESSIINEHLMVHHAGPTRLIPENIDAALKVRFMDRFFDNYVMTPMQTLVSHRMRTEDKRDAKGVSDARTLLDVAYRWLDKQIKQQAWAAGSDFTLADWPQRLRFSMRTGCIPSATNFLLSATIAADYLPDHRLPERLMRLGPTASCFRSARQIAIDEQIALTSAARIGGCEWLPSR